MQQTPKFQSVESAVANARDSAYAVTAILDSRRNGVNLSGTQLHVCLSVTSDCDHH